VLTRAEATRKLAETLPPAGTYQEARSGLQEAAKEAEPIGLPGNPTGRNQHSEERLQGNNSSPLPRGNHMDYILARLKRDAATNPKAQEALDGIRDGSITSARQAGIHAGIVRVPTTLDRLRALWKSATPDERAAFAQGEREALRRLLGGAG
jgi:hypothetical protein